MATDTPAAGDANGGPGRAAWWTLVLAAAVLLVLSEALWLWQTWPVRELLRPLLPAGGA